MNSKVAREQVRKCLQRVRPDFDLSSVTDETELLSERIISSFQVIDLIIHLEAMRGRPLERSDLEPGSFRNIETIAANFFGSMDSV